MPFEIIDFHMHPFFTQEENSASFYLPVSQAEAVPEDLRRAGITRFAGSVIVRVDGHDFAPVRQMNDHALLLRERYSGAYIPGFHIHPAFVRESCEELLRAKRQGITLIGELVPYMMGWDAYASKDALEIFDLASQLGMVVSAHPTNDADMEALAEAFPHLRIVYAHPGNFAVCAAQVQRLMRYDNLYLDISGTGLFRYGMLRYAVERAGADRILFGTDYPICNPQMQVAGVLYERIRDCDREKIFSGNARALLGLA